MTTIKCANVYGHGMETLAEVIANSCNDAMMQIGAAMGAENFLKAQSTFQLWQPYRNRSSQMKAMVLCIPLRR